MKIRTTPLISGMKYLAIAIPLAACAPPSSDVKPQNDQTSDQSSSFFGRLFHANNALTLPEANMIERDMACVPYLGEETPPGQLQTVDVPTGDLWQRMREGMTISQAVSDARVQREIAFYQKNPKLLRVISERAALYMHFVVDELEQRDMPLELALIPAIESTYNPLARSPGGAVGMWQFMPGTARVYGLTTTNGFDERKDVVESTRAALGYFQRLHRQLRGDWFNAVAGYNTGELYVANAIKRNERQGKSTDFWNLGLRTASAQYVPKLVALSKIVANPEKYGVRLSPIVDQPTFVSITVDPRTNLTQAANLAGISPQELFELNPAINRYALPRNSYTLHVPLEKRSLFELAMTRTKSQPASNTRYAAQPQPNRPATANTSDQLYTVKSGDNLWRISRQLHVSASDIAKWNNLGSKPLRTGQRIVIKGSSSAVTEASKKNSTTAAAQNKQNNQHTIGYSVKSGDSLARIADRFDVTVDEIRRWNTLGNDLLKPGQKLTLQVDN